MSKCLTIGIRPSLLAFKQAQEIQQCLPQVAMDIVSIETTGDSDKTTPLSFREDSDFFTDTIECALINGDIDAAVHSAKDLECNPPEVLVVVATTASVSQDDCLVSCDDQTLDQLHAGARIGTSSRARKEGILRYRDDLTVNDIRGNVDDRLIQLDRGDFDAIIVAKAALIRLGLQDRIAQVISQDIIQPHPLQGRLAIQVRKDRKELKEIFGALNER